MTETYVLEALWLLSSDDSNPALPILFTFIDLQNMRLLGLEGEVGQVRERKEVRREDGEGQEGRGHVEARAGEERSGGKA